MDLRFLPALVAVHAFAHAPPAWGSECTRPEEPFVPYGYRADSAEMDSARADVEWYIDEMEDYLWCLEEEADDARFTLERVIDESNEAIEDHNRR